MSKFSKTRGGTLISQVNQVCGRVWNNILRSNGLSDLEGARGRVLFALWSEDCVPIKSLCKKTSLDKATMTGIIARLERDGYISRKPDETDARSCLVCRTGKDEFFTKKVPAVSDEMNAVFYKGFSVQEAKLLDTLLERLLSNCLDAEKAYKER